MNRDHTTEAEPIHISGRGQLLWSGISGRPQRALCGFNLEGPFDGRPDGTTVCRPCAKKAKWTAEQIAEHERALGGA